VTPAIHFPCSRRSKRHGARGGAGGE
jgi:hypothetical protein